MNKKCFTFLESFWETVQALPEEMQVGAMNAIVKYGLYGELPEDPIMLAIVTALRSPIDEGHERREARIEAAKAAAAARWSDADACDRIETQCDSMPKEKEKDKEKVKDKEKESKEKERRASARFAPPSIDDVRAYCKERGNSVKPEQFVAFYESVGWKVGNKPMKDWKAAVRTWEQREAKSERPPNRFHNFEERKTDYDAMLGVI